MAIANIHHIAWAVKDEDDLIKWKELFDELIKVSTIKDRKYFKSTYIRP